MGDGGLRGHEGVFSTVKSSKYSFISRVWGLVGKCGEEEIYGKIYSTYNRIHRRITDYLEAWLLAEP